VVVEQGKLVEHLKKQGQRQSAVLETMELERIKANNPKPPHHQGAFSKSTAARKFARLWWQLLTALAERSGDSAFAG
jgi:thymidylate synthase